MTDEQTSIRVSKDTRERLAQFAFWGESLDHSINRGFDLLLYNELYAKKYLDSDRSLPRRWDRAGGDYYFQFSEGTITYYRGIHNLFGSVRIILRRPGGEIKLWLKGDEWEMFGINADGEFPSMPPPQSDLTDVPIIGKFGEVEKIVGKLTIRAASMEGSNKGYPDDPSLNDLIWMDYLIDNYERIIDETTS